MTEKSKADLEMLSRIFIRPARQLYRYVGLQHAFRVGGAGRRAVNRGGGLAHKNSLANGYERFAAEQIRRPEVFFILGGCQPVG